MKDNRNRKRWELTPKGWRLTDEAKEDRLTKWMQSEEAEYLRKHCLKEYYATLQEIRDAR